MLEARRVAVDRLDRPRAPSGRRPAAAARAPLLNAAATSSFLPSPSTSPAVRKRVQAVVERRDHRARLRGRAGVVAADLDRVHQLLASLDVALDRDVELVACRRRRRRRPGSPSRGARRGRRRPRGPRPLRRHVAHHVARLRRCRRAGSARSASRRPRACRRRRDRRSRPRARRCPAARSSSVGVEAVGRRAQHRDDALVVRRDRDRLRAVAVEVGDLGVAHAAELAAEVLLPERRSRCERRRACLLPELHDRRGAAEREQPRGRRRRGRPSPCGRRCSAGPRARSCATRRRCGTGTRAARRRDRLAVLLHELREREHEAARQIGGRRGGASRGRGAAAPRAAARRGAARSSEPQRQHESCERAASAATRGDRVMASPPAVEARRV